VNDATFDHLNLKTFKSLLTVNFFQSRLRSIFPSDSTSA